MKIVLLLLSGDSALAQHQLIRDYPDATIENISRKDFETGSLSRRLGALRARRPDLFAIVTERLSWQRGQNLFFVFGALAGAGEVLMMDMHGGTIRKSRWKLLLRAPASLIRDALAATSTLGQARRELDQLERQVGLLPSQPDGMNVVPSAAAPDRAVRIVYLRSTPGPGTQAGGAASHIKGVVEALVELGAEVEVISNDRIAGFDETKVPLIVIEPESCGGTRAVFDIRNNQVFTRAAIPLLQERKPDIIYQRYARFSWAGVMAALKTTRPLFLEYNGSEVWVGRHWDRVGKLDLLERYERLNLEAATRIFVVSNVERHNLETIGIDPKKIVVNPNGVDTELFRPNVGGDEERRRLGIRDDEVLIGFVGTFGPWHGVLVLAEAIKSIPAGFPVRFLLVGSGSLHAESQNLLETERESGRVIFTGSVSHQRVPSLLDACNVLVAPHVPLAEGNEFFGSPTKLFEYMAMGKGIVASRLGQIGDVLVHEETALLVEPGNVAALTAALLRLIQSPDLRVRLGKNARDVAVRNYTWRHNAERVLAAYRSWCGEQ